MRTSVKQWERLKGGVVVVSAAKDRNDSGLRLSPGKKYRIVPHPTDTWQPTSYYSSSGQSKSVTWKGASQTYTINGRVYSYASSGDFLEGALVMQIENGTWKKPGLIEGEGRLWLGPYSDSSWGAGGKGEIRVKILPGDDE
ncbi:MAG TPA: hypothetical protein VHX44_09440 [Planctomycetota bacterium]|nr:hypothetical protein [Planctomycetota bacterium]